MAEDFNILLIEQIKRYPWLYNVGHKDYKDLTKRNNTWAAISKTLNAEEAFVRKRWTSLRDRYTKLRKEEDRRGTSIALRSKKKWKYTEMLHFVGDLADKSSIGEIVAESSDCSLPVTSESNALDFTVEEDNSTPQNDVVVESSEHVKTTTCDVLLEASKYIESPHCQVIVESSKQIEAPQCELFIEASKRIGPQSECIENERSNASSNDSTPYSANKRKRKQEKDYKEELCHIVKEFSRDEVLNKKDSEYYYCMSLVDRMRTIKSSRKRSKLRLAIEQAFLDAEDSE